jgi:predicted O-methyltransferase YrrM
MWTHPQPAPMAATAVSPSSCSVEQVAGARHHAAGSSSCVIGQNLGCYPGERKMWLVAPCHGTFRCDGFELQCKSSRITEKPGRRHNCTCFEYEATTPEGRLVAGMVPLELSHSRLVEGSIRHARFVPNTTAEILHATFAFWNVLDRIMLQSSRSNYQTGYVREVQVRRMVQLVTAPGVRTYCEVGMNGGHSASAMLHANPELVVHSFDIMFWNYSWPVANILSTAFGHRFVMHPGDSRVTVPQWAAEQRAAASSAGGGVSCDVILVDGDHSLSGASADLHNFRPLASPGAPVIIDDTATAPGAALKALAKAGELRVHENFGPYDPPSRFNRCLRTINRGAMCLPWGFSVGEYVRPSG